MEESHHHCAQHHCGKVMDRPGEICAVWRVRGYTPTDPASTLKMSSQPFLFCLWPVRGNRCGESHYWRPLPPEVCTLQLLLQRCGQEGGEPSFFFNFNICLVIFSVLHKNRNNSVPLGQKCIFSLANQLFLSSGDRGGDGQGWKSPLRSVGYLGWEDGVFTGDAEQPRRRKRHGGQTENCLSNPQSSRSVEEEPTPVSTVPALPSAL